jgi:hypothetical protein
MAKNIAICCDGTGNDFNRPETDSNVVKLYNTLRICDGQIAYYHPGVGTMGAPNANSRFAKWWSKVEGLAIGKGLLDNVGDAYRYLMNTYSDGDNIFIFGFSRGAYTARAVASILHVYGLLEPGNEQLIPYILRMYAQKSKAAQEATIPAEDAFKYAFSRDVEVHFCGVWDTVSSYGWLTSPINLRFNGQNPIIRTGRHAVSIHEHRCFYQDSLWGPSLAATSEGPQQDIRQVWFGGVHSDVGGSYDESEAGLSKITFEWMLVEARKQGLLVDDQRAEIVLGEVKPPPALPEYVKPDPKGMLHASLTSWWWILECIPRTRNGRLSVPLGRWWRQIPEGSVIHETVGMSGTRVTYPKTYEVEPWVRFVPAGMAEAPEAVAPLHAVVVQKLAAAAEPTGIHRLFRR